jgi:hypothetical protein
LNEPRNQAMNRSTLQCEQAGPQVAVAAVLAMVLLASPAYCSGHGKPAADHSQPAASHEKPAGEYGPENSDAPRIGTNGVELGEFAVRSYYPVEAQKSTVHFVLVVSGKPEQRAELQEYVESHRQRIRDQIITATRLAPLAVFEESDLATFRRRLAVRLRRALPDLEFDDIYVADFDLIVKSL